MKVRQYSQLRWNHQYQKIPRRNYGEKRRKSCHFKFILGFNVIIEYRKRNTEWFSRYQKHSKNIPAKISELLQHSDRVEANQEYNPTLTINRPSRDYEASNCCQVEAYYTNHDHDACRSWSRAAATLDLPQTNSLDPRPLSNADLQLTSNMLCPDIEASFPRQNPANLPLKEWPTQALQTDFPTSSSMLSFDVNDQFLSAAVTFDAFGATMCDPRALLDANLPIGTSTLDSDLRAPYLGDFSTDVPSRHSHAEAPQTTSIRTSSVLDSNLQAPYLGDFSTDVPSGNSQFEASQTNFPMTSSRLDPDLRAPYLGSFPADIPVRPSQLDASLADFSTTSSIPNSELNTPLDNRLASTTAGGSFQMNFPDPWITSDPFTQITFVSDLRAPCFGNYPMDIPARISSFPDESPTELDCDW
jgi:hypothetical protein